MTEQEIRRLLAAAMAYDNRNPGDAAVLAWQEAAERARWTFDGALNALHEHYANSVTFLMPGHITERIRAERRQPARVTAIAPAAPPTDAERAEAFRRGLEGVPAGVVQVAEEMGRSFALPADLTGQRSTPTTSADHAAARERARVELANLTPAPIPTEDR